jgi:PAS domain S-box-containing protein
MPERLLRMASPGADVGGESFEHAGGFGRSVPQVSHHPSSSLRPLFDASLGDDVVVALVDAAPDGIMMADQSGQILFVNRQMEEMFGYDRADLLGRSVDELLPGRLQQVHRAHRMRYRAEPRTRAMGADLALSGERADGTEFPVEISLSPLATDTGLKVVAVVRDVTERLAMEAEQREIRDALDAASDAVLILDADTLRFTHVNDGAVEQVGYSREELLRMTMLQITPDLTEQELRAVLGPLERGEQSSVVFTTVHRRRDGVDIPVEILVQAIPNADGGPPRRYIKIARDIRERLAAEERLHRAEQHLRVVEDRERIACDLHDIVIQKLFAAGMTLQGVWSRTTDADQAHRLAGVVDDLDDTIREIRSVIFSLQAQVNQRGGVRADILAVVREQQPVLGFEPRVRFEGPVETIGESIAIELLAVVREALSNVARHAGASEAQVVLECGDEVVLRVQDNGRGMPTTVTAGSGIPNLATRAQMSGGDCRITTRADGGAELEWRVPSSG